MSNNKIEWIDDAAIDDFYAFLLENEISIKKNNKYIMDDICAKRILSEILRDITHVYGKSGTQNELISMLDSIDQNTIDLFLNFLLENDFITKKGKINIITKDNVRNFLSSTLLEIKHWSAYQAQ